MKVIVGINDAGMRVGQDHQNAKVSDEDVELLLALHTEGWSYRRLADKFELSKSQVRNICKGRKRSQFPTRWKVIERPTA